MQGNLCENIKDNQYLAREGNLLISSLLKYAPIQIISSLSVFGLIALQTRLLDIEVYGLLALAMVILEVIRSISSQWINGALIRLYPETRTEEKAALAETSLLIIWLLFIPAVSAIGIGLYIYNQMHKEIWLWVSSLLFIKSLYLYSLDICRLKNNTHIYRAAVLLQSALSILLTWIFLSYYSKIEIAIAALTLSYAIPWILFLRTIPIKYEHSTARRIFSYGTPLLLAGGITALGSRLDRIFIAEHLDLSTVGSYSALSNMILGIVALMFAVVSVPTYPELAKSINDRESLQKKHSSYLDLLLAITLPSMVGMCISAESLVNLVLTEEYSDLGIELFWILGAAAYLLNIKGHYIDHGLQFLLKTKYLPWISATTTLISIILLIFSINTFGIHGAAWSWLTTNMLAAIASYAVSCKLGFYYGVGRNFFKVILATAGMTAALLLASNLLSDFSHITKLAYLVITGVTSYATLMILINAFNLRDKLSKRFFLTTEPHN